MLPLRQQQGNLARYLFVFLAPLLGGTVALSAVVTTKSGMQFHGRVDKIGSINENPLEGDVAAKPILLIDDHWRRTFVRGAQATYALSPASGHEKIHIPQRVPTSGRRIHNVGPIIEISPFDEFGRRIFSMQGPRGQLDIFQGITEITPTYTKVESLVEYLWDMRVATSSIPRETLSRIIYGRINPDDPDARLAVVHLYIQSERYADALVELERIIKDFPGLKHLKEQASRLRQLFAEHLLREIQLRWDAGQHLRVNALLKRFPTEGIAGETLLRVRNMLGEQSRQTDQYAKVMELFGEHTAAIKDPAIQATLTTIHDELQNELNLNTLPRMADYLRLADDETLPAEQKVALAVSGWLLGSGSGEENLAVAISLFETRNEIRNYLRAERTHERQESLARIESQEGGAPAYVAKLIAQMTPPVETQEGQLEIPGFYKLSTPGVQEQPAFTYYVQLPPEYDPHRRYPCIVTLNGAGSNPQQQVDWWAGSFPQGATMRLGQAARRGYIVVAPEWSKPHQREYEYSSREHAAVLYCLRDACRRTSIDTDRVFLSGHSMGGDACWDIGFAHPDLWAGVIPIVARADKYVLHYGENARGLPLYFVGGEMDAGWLHKNGNEFDDYLKRARYDTTIVQFQGRGHEHFQDEILRIFDWMELPAHRRDFFPQKFEAVAMRPWDNFYWWLELRGFPEPTIVMPATWASGSKRPSKIKAEVHNHRRLSVTTGAREVTLWLSPDLVSFERGFKIVVNGRTLKEKVAPNVETLLEDVRTRGDRQHPFWAKVVTAGRGR